jgi:hypothetical protein
MNTNAAMVAIAFAILACSTTPVCRSQGTSGSPESANQVACTMLQRTDFSHIQDAPTQLIGAKWVYRHDGMPAYCEVGGYVTPNIQFRLRLPPNSWNGKFIELGCGGFCGSTGHITGCDDPLRRGYACIVSDDGHRSTAEDDLWAYNNPQAELDHGYRAAHVTALAGKAIVEAYYRRAPARSYFVGCSTGGRQAMVEAQRFPWDFNGIVAGAPSLSVPGSHLTHIWWLRALTDKNRRPLLSHDELAMVHAAALQECDMDDGVRDGIISNPHSCRFNPTKLLCRGDMQTRCLSQAQVDALNKAYAGPMTSKGASIYPGKAFPGAELNLISDRVSAVNIAAEFSFVANEFRYSAFDPPAGPGWQPEDFDFDRDYKRLGEIESLSSARNPDLRSFKAAGGKLIAYVGLNDIDQADVTIDYYHTTESTMGGRLATRDFFRLFVTPGMNHCTGGDGAFAVDYLDYLELWVEKNQAPDKLIGSHVKLADLNPENPKDALEATRRQTFPLDPATVQFSRPVYPYPTIAKYSGHGDPNDAANFGPAEPLAPGLAQSQK